MSGWSRIAARIRVAHRLAHTAAAVGVALGASALLSAQQPPAGGAQPSAAAPQVLTAPQRYKNIQVLKDIPAAQITPGMHLIAGELGVGCTYCHIWEEWDRDDRPAKATARRMMTMMFDLNKSMFGRATVITCYTCHRGKPKPVNIVELPSPVVPRFDAPPPPPLPALPSADQIVGRYIQALGGEEKLRKITSRVITGTEDIASGPGGIDATPAEVEIYQKAPRLTLNVYKTAKFTISDGFDGTGAWTQNIAGAVNTVPMPDHDRVRRGANFYEPLELTQTYSGLETRSLETVGRHQAYVVVGAPEGDMPERLYFDTQTGLLLRRATFFRTPFGDSPFEVDFDDYRDVSGVKMPFVIRMNPAGSRTELGTSSTLHVTKMRTNVAIDDAMFARPKPRPPAPAAR